jgi:hypothetical protein
MLDLAVAEWRRRQSPTPVKEPTRA